MSNIFLTRMPISGVSMLGESVSLSGHTGYANFHSLPEGGESLPFRLKSEKNVNGGWYSIVREKDHSGAIELHHYNKAESLKIDSMK
jgi:hypothetical protein